MRGRGSMVAVLDVGRGGDCDEFMSGQKKKFLAWFCRRPGRFRHREGLARPYFNFPGREKTLLLLISV